MYSTCLFCKNHLPGNQAIEAFPVGRRLAFDAVKGRLWVVCRNCERWNLTPLDERWEAVEECERQYRDARKRYATDNIGLARLDEGTDLVRVGTPLLPEFAAWRYGDQFGRRRRRRIIGGSVVGLGAAAAIAGSLGLVALAVGSYWVYRAADIINKRIGDRRIVANIPTSSDEILTVLGQHLPDIQLAPDRRAETGWHLELFHVEGSHTLQGKHALNAMSLVMPSINGTGGSRHTVERAIKHLEGVSDPVHYVRAVAAKSAHGSRPGPEGALIRLPGDMRLALEMAANEENERFALEGEIALLEMAWEEAEEIAAIADNLMVPPHVDAQLKEMRRAARRNARSEQG